ncbi:MAG: hypothetical protein M3R49_07480 [Chloroflexota bacterium]|nr:hypothetical protein [Chloroflexota bacterium]
MHRSEPLERERKTCELCGDPIDVGQAWMLADQEGAVLRAHAGCVYRDEAKQGEHPDWQPQERAAS